MGVLNRIMLILILLAAAGSTVLSYFLFEKRTEMLRGWQLMAEQIDKTAQQIDKGAGSGTKLTTSIKAKEFTHRELADMETKLKRLPQGVDELNKQRNELIEVIYQLSQIADNKIPVNKDALAKAETSNAAGDELVKQIRTSVQAERSANRKILNNFAKAGEPLGVSSSEEEIRRDYGSNLLSEIRKKAEHKDSLIAKANAALRQISSDHSGDAEATGKRIAANMKRLEERLRGEERAKRNAQNEASSLRNKNAALERSNRKFRADVTKLSTEVTLLKKRLNPTNNADINRMEYGKKDANYYLNLYSMVRGEVKKIDSKWNFVVVDLGAKTEIRQTYAGRTYKTVLDITPGKVLTVVRGIDTKKPEIVAEIVLSEVYADHSVADIKLRHSQIKEGDVVIFDKKHNQQLTRDIQNILNPKR